MFVVALKRAGFAVSWSRTASWEIPTVELIATSEIYNAPVSIYLVSEGQISQHVEKADQRQSEIK
jgi:hypothetical protein